jgi:hypothetical protein
MPSTDAAARDARSEPALLRHGAWRSYFLEKGVILAVSRGVQVAELAPHLIHDGERAIATYGSCLYMVDACESSRMDTRLREALTGWLSANRHCATMHVLLRSNLLEMAVHVAALTTGRGVLVAHREPAPWEEVARQEIPGFKRRPWTATSLEFRDLSGELRES